MQKVCEIIAMPAQFLGISLHLYITNPTAMQMNSVSSGVRVAKMGSSLGLFYLSIM